VDSSTLLRFVNASMAFLETFVIRETFVISLIAIIISFAKKMKIVIQSVTK